MIKKIIYISYLILINNLNFFIKYIRNMRERKHLLKHLYESAK
jgi:hypothetical protein